MIKKVETNSFGNPTIHVIGLSPLVQDHEASFLVDLEDRIEIVDPVKTALVADESPFFSRSRLYIESQWRQKVPTDTRLHIGDKAAMNLLPFQLEPAQISLRQPRQRILIADAVGLGKTLEAGILISELIARGKGKRILVVTVKSMMTQFQKELWNRFTIPLVRLDSNKIQRIRAQIPANYNPFFYYDRTIISMDTLKRDVEYRTHLENAWWDIIVIDEAHNVAVRGKRQAQRSRLAQLLAKRSDTLIMLSATPHDGRSESFASLMNMLDPTAIANPHDYTKDDIKGMCVRRFKKDIRHQIEGVFKERRISIEKCRASAKEEMAFDVFTSIQLKMVQKGRGAAQLFKTTLEKSLFSSPAACIKSIDERIRRLERNIGTEHSRDINALLELKAALEEITPDSFSRYTNLLDLLRSESYGWNPDNTADRIVIFTERIETMRYVAAHLRQDLNLPEKAVQELYGGMSDIDQQRIVEEFGRTESPIRILVASDVASEGINLHYLCHRLIHFDIPWSLMVFQQRNGRIDRYGQTKQPDIRYLMIQSENEKIKGDMRILEILVEKEEQATKNIGDPAVLMGVFDIEEEEKKTADAIETGISAEEFDLQLSVEEAAFDPLELLMMGATEDEAPVEVASSSTLFSDLDYLSVALEYFMQKERYRVEKLRSVPGLEIQLTPELKSRLAALMPEEALPANDTLRLSPDKEFCMLEMQRSLQQDIIESPWPATQYLWPLHPIFDWVNDKASLLFGRQEAPIIGLPNALSKDEYIFLIAGSIPNRKSTPVVDEWFGLRYKNGQLMEEMNMEEAMAMTKYHRGDIPNRANLPEEQIKQGEALLPAVIKEANKVMHQHYQSYKKQVDPQIDDELDKLAELHHRHHQYIHETLSERRRRREEELHKVDKLFDEFVDWVRDTLEIETNAHVRIVGVMTGVST